MVVKLIGGIMIVFSLYSYGWYMAECIKKRREELIDIKNGLVLLADETLYTGGALWEVFEAVGDRCSGRTKELFLKMAELLYERNAEGVLCAWEQALDESFKGSFLSDEDKKSIRSFGRGLGFADANCQVSNINMTLSYIDEKKDELKDKYIEQSRLYKSLGIMAGLMAVVVIF